MIQDQMPRIKYWLTIFGVFMGIFYGFGQRKYKLAEGFGESISSGMYQMIISVLLIIAIIFIFRKISNFLLFGFLKKNQYTY